MDGDAALARQRTGRVSGTKPAPSSGWVPADVGLTDAPQRHSAGGAGVGCWAQAHDPCALLGGP